MSAYLLYLFWMLAAMFLSMMGIGALGGAMLALYSLLDAVVDFCRYPSREQFREAFTPLAWVSGFVVFVVVVAGPVLHSWTKAIAAWSML